MKKILTLKFVAFASMVLLTILAVIGGVWAASIVSTPVSGSVSYEPVYYTVTFNANGGSFSDGSTTKTQSVLAGSSLESFPEISYGDYELLGWFTTSTYNLSNKVSASYTPAKDVTLYAHWNAIFTTSGNSITGLTSYGKTLSSIEIPSSINGKTITSIAESAFKGNTTLTSVTIPEGIELIGNYAFYDCTALTEINYNAKSCADLTSGSTNVFYNAGTSRTGITVTIGDSVEKIPANLFRVADPSCKPNITSVTIGQNVSSIGSCAFWCCDLNSVTIPSSVTSIGDSAFANCTNLSCINFEEICQINTIGRGLFSNCHGLTSIIIPTSVTSIGSSAFNNCYGLTSIIIPTSVTSIGNSAFYNCIGLSNIYYCGSESDYSSITVASSAFSTCYATCCYYSEETPIIDGSFWRYVDGVPTVWPTDIFKTDGEGTIVGLTAYGKTLATLEIPSLIGDETITAVGASAFAGCSALTSIIIPNSVTSISNEAFSGCNALETITVDSANTMYKSDNNCLLTHDGATLVLGCKNSIISSSVTTIGSSAFYNCVDLTSISIPSSVTTIESYAFYNCSKLTRVDITDLESWCNTTFISAASNPTYYAKHLYLNGTEITDLVIPSSITEIKGYAFYNCSSLTSVTIPSSVTTIGSSAFSGCTGLTSISISEGVASIGVKAFSGCTGLTKIYIPSSVTTISASSYSNSSFYNCSSTLKIYCEASSKPSGWGTYWNYYASGKKLSVTWGITPEEFAALGD